MDGINWDAENQPFTGSQQEYYNSIQLSQNGLQQPRYGGQQQHFQSVGQQFQGAQHPQIGQHQQQLYGAQQIPPLGQQAQDGQFGMRGSSSQSGLFVPGQQNQSQYGSQQLRAQSGGQQQLSMSTQHSSTGLVGRHFPSLSGNSDQNASASFGQAAAWTPSGRNASAPTAPQSFTSRLAAAQQNAANLPRQQFLQVPMAAHVPSGQQSPNGYGFEQSSGNSFNPQILPRHRPLSGQPQSTSDQQQYMAGSQQSQRIPMAIRGSSGQLSSNSFGPQALPRLPSHGTQSHSIGGQHQHLDNRQQFSPVASQFQNGVQQKYQGGQSSGHSQQFSPTAAQFQPGLQQHFAAAALNLGGQQTQAIRQTSTASQQSSPSATQFQPGAQQHFANNLPNQPGTQYQGWQRFSQGQRDLGAPNSNPNYQQFPRSSTDYQLRADQGNAATQQFGPRQQPLGIASQLLNEHLHEGNAFMGENNGLYDDHQFGEEGKGGEQDPHQQALPQTEQRLDENNTGEGLDVDKPIPEDMTEDPVYQQTLQQVKQWKEQYNISMTEDQQARLAAQETWKKKDSIKSGKRLAELDEDDIDEDVIEEAVRDAKRQRTRHEHLDFHVNAHKVYVLGPENRSEPMDTDDNSEDEDQVTSFDLDLEILGLPAEFKGEFSGQTLSLADSPFKKPYEHQVFDRNFRLIESICCDWAFMIEVTKHLRVKDIIMLYSVSRTFHNLVNLRFQSTIAAWAQEISPSGWKVFYWKFYGSLAMKDPAGKPWAMPGPVSMPRPPWAKPARIISMTHRVRSVPSFKYLAMLAQRETRTRDILACLARAGHRLPETTHVTLKKIWMLMDIYTNKLRRAFIRNENIWTPRDLYNAQMFYLKLQMRFNEPVFGPKSTVLADTFLGLRDGLNSLWRLLRRKDYLRGEEIIQQRLRYYCRESVVQHHLLIGRPCVGVHPYELGNEHKEGWGAGKLHLSRPDELVIEESVRRNLRMDKHLVFMLFWGHVDWQKRLNLVPTEEEMYMSDDELPPLPKKGKYAAHGMWGRCGNVPFEFDNWQPKHSMKARWKTLTREEKLAIIKDDQDEQMRALPFEKDVGDKFWELPYNANDRAHPDYPGGEPPMTEETEPEDADGDTQMGETDDEYSGSEESFFADGVDASLEEQLMNPNPSSPYKPADEGDGSAIVEYEYTYEDESLPLPDSIEDLDIIANWYDLDPYLQQKIIDEHERAFKQDVKDERTLAIIVNGEMERLAKAEEEQKAMEARDAQQHGESSASAHPSHHSSVRLSPYTSPMQKQPKRYQYPGITDPISLALLERYDRFTPEEFRTDADGNILCGEQSSSGSSSSTTGRVIELSDYDEYDDDDLKALADEEYDSDQVGFDLDSYQKFLERVGDDGGFKDPDAEDDDDTCKGKGKGKGKAKAKAKGMKDVKGKGKAVVVESSDDEDDYNRDEMAYEGDLDDDLPLPKYDFRKF